MNVFDIPHWKLRTASMQMNSVDTVLVMALVLREHGTAAAIRAAAHRLAGKVMREQQPKMKALARLPDDKAVIQCALNIVQRTTDALGILPGQPFVFGPVPKCHYKPMVMTESGWQCQHCSHTKPLAA